jgi:hypothetical protein
MRLTYFRSLVLAFGLALTAGGCVVHERVAVVRPAPPPCPGGVWIGGHYGPYGYWHPGHWQCPVVLVPG